MVVYNVTTKVAWQIEDNWLTWQKESYIPSIMASALIVEYKIFRLLDQQDEDGPTYTTQFFFNSIEKYELYIQLHSTAMRSNAISKWGNQSISFHTVMELVD